MSWNFFNSNEVLSICQGPSRSFWELMKLKARKPAQDKNWPRMNESWSWTRITGLHSYPYLPVCIDALRRLSSFQDFPSDLTLSTSNFFGWLAYLKNNGASSRSSSPREKNHPEHWCYGLGFRNHFAVLGVSLLSCSGIGSTQLDVDSRVDSCNFPGCDGLHGLKV